MCDKQKNCFYIKLLGKYAILLAVLTFSQTYAN